MAILKPCSIPDCSVVAVCRGLCDRHYRQAKKAGVLPPKVQRFKCSVEQCERKHYARGFCESHYNSERASGGLILSACQVPGCGRNAVSRKACSRHYGLMSTYSLSLEQVSKLLSNGCAICHTTETVFIDHDHSCCPGDRSCGDCVRGVLCRNCNSGLGLFRDNPNLLAAAIEYLFKSTAKLVIV